MFRRAGGDGLEEMLEGVCLIPGAGEFVLADEVVLRRDGLTRATPENLHNGEGRPDLQVSLDQLEAQCPNLKRVSLVVGWFGDDLRAGHCQVKPGVERRGKATEPLTWTVAGLTRGTAHLVSEAGGVPAYGGTPSDDSVRQAVAALKARGWKVTLYPFIFMDIPADNDLPDPYGGARQAAYPWRGRIKGVDGPGAASQVAALLGGSDGWGLRRLALHYARLAAETGADGLLIGSEMRGLTWTRDAEGGHPAVAQFQTLAAECRAILGGEAELSYAADWSEYFGFQPADGSGDVVFHLDPLWADEAISHVAIDWYPPLGDWRAGGGGIDAEVWRGPSDRAYLAAQVAGGDGFDWYYASPEDRAGQVRSLITDGAHGEPWIYRCKDLVSWWSKAHHDRRAGVRSETPTAWIPEMKPIRLTEFGCPAVDRGGNSPNLFQDTKSAEGALPPYSNGARDDRMQRRALEAVLRHFLQAENNPLSALYGGPMLDGADAWCWDARPFPDFPARGDVWADAEAWRTGHWLNGRLIGEAADMLAAILRRGGVADEDFEIGETGRSVEGFVIDRPMPTRNALAPLLTALGMVSAERGGRIALIGHEAPAATLGAAGLALPENGDAVVRTRTAEPTPRGARVRFIDEAASYQTGSVTVRAAGDGPMVDLDLPAVCSAALAQAVAQDALEGGGGEGLTLHLGPVEGLRLEPGDRVELDETLWRIDQLDHEETSKAVLSRPPDSLVGEVRPIWRDEGANPTVGTPFLAVLDLPPLPGQETDRRPVVAVAADPWRPMSVWAGGSSGSLSLRATVFGPATVARLAANLGTGVTGRWDEVNPLLLDVEGLPPSSLSADAVLAGGNAVAVQTSDGWEILQFRQTSLIGGGIWRMSGLLRGLQGTEAATKAGAGAGALVVFLDRSLARAEVASGEIGLPLIWTAGQRGGAPLGSGASVVHATLAGVHGRPFSPAHLRIAKAPAGRRIRWMARTRMGGDVWEGEPVATDPDLFHVSILSGDERLRSWEVEGLEALYGAGEIDADFPEGIGADVWVSVAQADGRLGWGTEARAQLVG